MPYSSKKVQRIWSIFQSDITLKLNITRVWEPNCLWRIPGNARKTAWHHMREHSNRKNRKTKPNNIANPGVRHSDYVAEVLPTEARVDGEDALLVACDPPHEDREGEKRRRESIRIFFLGEKSYEEKIFGLDRRISCNSSRWLIR